jgi:hypothetical protein
MGNEHAKRMIVAVFNTILKENEATFIVLR